MAKNRKSTDSNASAQNSYNTEFAQEPAASKGSRQGSSQNAPQKNQKL